jgi:dTDP-4-amino-4,6-dideoxygalactose transaminase
MKRIPLIRPDLPALEDIAAPLREILSNGKITNFSKYVTQFEEESSRYLDAQALTGSSGTIDLVFALQSLGLQKARKPAILILASA